MLLMRASLADSVTEWRFANVCGFLISTYELGHQPFGLASPAAWLRRDGSRSRCVDLTKEKLDWSKMAEAGLVAFHLPMHTANAAGRRPSSGKSVPLNPSGAHLRVRPVRAAQRRVAAIAWRRRRARRGVRGRARGDRARCLHRMQAGLALQPERPRTALPTTSVSDARSARASAAGRNTRRCAWATARARWRGIRKPAAAAGTCAGIARSSRSTTASSESCRAEVVLADVTAQVAAGAEHITFGDPGLLQWSDARRPSGDRASRCASRAHLRRHDQSRAPAQASRAAAVLRGTGCLFVTSAVESLDDHVLALLEKGHTRAGFLRRGGSLPRRAADARADVRPVSSLDDARKLLRSAGHA